MTSSPMAVLMAWCRLTTETRVASATGGDHALADGLRDGDPLDGHRVVQVEVEADPGH